MMATASITETPDFSTYADKETADALVARAKELRPFLMADMPFMTYTSKDEALKNAVRLMQEGGAKMVKLEGGAGQAEIVEFLASHDIAVCAHLGLRPQSVHKTGGFRVQGREDAAEGFAFEEVGEDFEEDGFAHALNTGVRLSKKAATASAW